jgi:hypothetical protein
VFVLQRERVHLPSQVVQLLLQELILRTQTKLKKKKKKKKEEEEEERKENKKKNSTFIKNSRRSPYIHL